ncbi:hypothetical protein B0T26DRAFT_669628 [Lasiosphaeria miniovina]|uniref:AA1-like domain-containing protein n=1 Tax=Lasiosphaeria miniovina TaxID=1954250 RepID=A0AA40BFB5_9PEZI|nr:uncharacterized protein B0T26DRAFT_669628 [Lasiosphaeria miniovina]KAK0733198.1 hypothetical protein B0T26DRAFT_669628 [Lasiosphaeria miniovina]
MAPFSTALAALLLAALLPATALPHHHQPAAPSPRQSPTPSASTAVCTDGATIPNLWSVHDLHIAYSHEGLSAGGNASFAVTDTRTNTTEAVWCALRLNYQCQVDGTPGNKNLSIWMQLNLAAYFTFSLAQACAGGTKAEVYGKAELMLVCQGETLEQGMTCAGDGEPAFVNATVATDWPQGFP